MRERLIKTTTTGASKNLTCMIAALGCLLIVGACSKKSKPAGTQTGAGPDGDVPAPVAVDAEAKTWASARATRSAELTVPSGAAGKGAAPELLVGARRFKLTPQDARLGALTWRHTRREDGALVVSGERERLKAEWVLPKGDPQARLSMSWRDVPLTQLAEPVRAAITLPPGKLEYINHRLVRAKLPASGEVTLHSWTPGWVQWSAGEEVLTIAQWRADQVTIRRDKADGPITLTFDLWNPAHHPSIHRCEVVPQGRDAITLKLDVTYVLGRRLELIPSRVEGGYLAAVSPVFFDPKLLADSALHDGAPKDAEDWLGRARTLAHGHSDMRDARFGNGGLAGGSGLGGALTVDAAHLESAPVRALIAQLEKTRVSVAATGEGARKDELRAWLTDDEMKHCAALLSRGTPAQRASGVGASGQTLLTLGEATTGDYLNVVLPRKIRQIGDDVVLSYPPSFTEGSPSSVYLPTLDGAREVLTDQLLSKLYLQKLAQDRGISWFATPLIATRNPLTRAASEAVLQPERQGHWTISPEISRALGAVDLLDDHDIVRFDSVEHLLRYWRAARKVRLYEQPDGAIIAHNPGPALPGFTLVMEGATPLLIDGAKPKARVVPMPEHQTRQTWSWWELKPGDTTITTPKGAQTLDPVSWRVREE